MDKDINLEKIQKALEDEILVDVPEGISENTRTEESIPEERILGEDEVDDVARDTTGAKDEDVQPEIISQQEVFAEDESDLREIAITQDEDIGEEDEDVPGMLYQNFIEKSKAVITNINEYKERLWRHRKQKWVRMACIAVCVLIGLFLIAMIAKYWKYSSYTVKAEFAQEDTTSSAYQKVGDNIIKYSLDNVTLLDDQGNSLWSETYKLNAPVVDSCEETFVIYDAQGTTMYVYQKDGEIGRVSTDKPIVKAKVAKQGVTVAILESDDNTWIQYYDTKGDVIASFKTTLDSVGYPLDVALSEDGMLMAVSCLQVKDGQIKTVMNFYNWGNPGQNQVDNLINTYTLEDTIVPQVEYLDEDTCLAFHDHGFVIYEGKQIPKEKTVVEEEGAIISTFYDDEYVGMVLHNEEGEDPFLLKVYRLNGKEVFSEAFDFRYQEIVMGDEQILLYNSNQMCVYSLSGVKKFEGDIKEGILSQLLPMGSRTYLLVTEGGTCQIRLR